MTTSIQVKISHKLVGGYLGRMTATDFGSQIRLANPVFEECVETLPDGSCAIMREVVRKHVREFLKDTRYCHTVDPDSGFECEMRVI